jgi:hypothetical protein
MAPSRFLYRGDDVVANVIIVGRGIRDVACQIRNGLKQIAARHDPDKLVAAHDRQTLDVAAFHKLHDVFQRRILGHGVRFPGHDLPDLAALLVKKVGCRPAGTKKEFEPSTALSLSPDLGTTDKVALRDDADQSSGFVDDRKSTDVVLQHHIRGIND